MAMMQQVIEKLNAVNYVSWARDLKYILIEKNCWNIVIGKEKTPIPDPAKEATTKELKDFEARSRVALSLIYLNIETEYKSLIEQCDDAISAWNLLQVHYQPDNRARHMALFSELLACRLSSEEKIDLFSARLRRISEQLKLIKQPLPDIYLCFQMIRYLPEEFDTIVQDILRWPEGKFTYDEILLALISEESRLKLREQDKTDHWNPECQFIKSKEKCRRCGRFGHQQRQCWSYGKERSPSPSPSTSSRMRSPYRLHADTTKPCANPETSRGYPTAFKRSSRSRHRGTRRLNPKPRNSFPPKSELSGISFSSYFTQTSFTKSNSDERGWVFDSAASHHFCKNKNFFSDFQQGNDKMSVAVGGITYPIEGRGKVMLQFGHKTVLLNNVMYTPKLRRNLISGPQIDAKGDNFSGGGGKVKVMHKDETIFTASLKNGIYYAYPKVIKNPSKKVKFNASMSQVNEMVKWHKKFAHVSPDLIENTSRMHCVKGLPHLKHAKFFCEPCRINKQKRVSFKSIKEIRSKRPLELLVMDTWGPSKHVGRRGEKYFLSIIDDYSRKTAIYPMNNKTEVFKIVKQHITRAERFLDLKVKTIRSDNGTEFLNEKFETFCRDNGIKHELTNIYTPEQNGICESNK